MKKLLVASVLTTLLAASTAFALESFKATQGRIESVDLAGKTVTLVGGMRFTAAPNLSIVPLTPGKQATIAYQDGKDGQKEMTAFWINAGPNS